MKSPEIINESITEEEKKQCLERIKEIKSTIEELEAQFTVPVLDIKRNNIDEIKKELKDLVEKF